MKMDFNTLRSLSGKDCYFRNIEEEVKNSKAKSLSLTASREFAVGLSNSRALAVWSRSIGKEVPANAADPNGHSFILFLILQL